MNNLFGGVYKDKTVLITGHTGFKGSWLSLWLTKMGAKVIGYSNDIPTTPNHFELLNLEIISIFGDIRDQDKLNETFDKYNPDIVFHLAAQSLVRESYEQPIQTYETNIMGTLKVFESCRLHKTKAIVNVTSDKSYENKEWIWGYKEDDRLGGYDPYSSSKACSEILTSSYRNSYFDLTNYKNTHNTLLSSCRAGNVIGGGDWAQDRLMTDIVRSASVNKKIKIRFPKAIRPWQHVLEPLSGYLLLGQRLLESKLEFASSWNFGPSLNQNITVEEVLIRSNNYWQEIKYDVEQNDKNPHEANSLKLDCSKAVHYLNWSSVWDSDTTFKKTILWYKKYYNYSELLTIDDLKSYVNDAKNKSIIWTR